jgi:hypothetical protein
MAAGFKYDLQPAVEMEERYDVQTGIRRRGEYKLVTEHLSVGATLPVFAPICADLNNLLLSLGCIIRSDQCRQGC